MLTIHLGGGLGMENLWITPVLVTTVEEGDEVLKVPI